MKTRLSKSAVTFFCLGHAILAVAGVAKADGDTPPNILLVSIDTLRADHTTPYGYGRMTTPEIGDFAKEAAVFTDCLVPVSLTLPTHLSMLTGMHPEEHGVRVNGVQVPDEPDFVSELLRENGYETFAAITTPMLTQQLNFDQGFDTFHLQYDGDREAVSNMPANELERWLEGRDGEQPFFAFLHYIDPHSPYGGLGKFQYHFMEKGEDEGIFHIEGYIPGLSTQWKYQQKYLSDPGLKRFIARYDEGIISADFQVGRVLDILEDNDLLDNTLIIITSDHGEGLGDGKNDFNHGDSVYQNTLRVPLIVKPPQNTGFSKSVDAPATVMDIAPTILDFAGIPQTDDLPHAISLKPLLTEEDPDTDAFHERYRFASSQGWRGPHFRRAIITPDNEKFIHDEWNEGGDYWGLTLNKSLENANRISIRVKANQAVEMYAFIKAGDRYFRLPMKHNPDVWDIAQMRAQTRSGTWELLRTLPLEERIAREKLAHAVLLRVEVNTARTTEFEAFFDEIAINIGGKWVPIEGFESESAPVWEHFKPQFQNLMAERELIENGRTDRDAFHSKYAVALKVRYPVHPYAYKLYDLDKDPEETRNLYLDKRARAELLHQKLALFYGDPLRHGAQEPDESAVEALRSLGYID